MGVIADKAIERKLANPKATAGTKTVLKMIFTTENGKSMTWNLEDPKDNLTYNEVATWMDNVITEDGILYQRNPAVEIKDAYIYTTTTTELD